MHLVLEAQTAISTFASTKQELKSKLDEMMDARVPLSVQNWLFKYFEKEGAEIPFGEFGEKTEPVECTSESTQVPE